MTLSRRLLIVALLCLLPSLAAGLFTQFDLRERRAVELRQLAMRQAQISSFDMHSILEAARQVGIAASRFDAVRGLRADCAAPLAEMHTRLPRYAFLALYDARGNLRCGSQPGLTRLPDWLGEITAVTAAHVGCVSAEPGVSARFLPVGVPVSDASGERLGTVVVAIDLDWLQEHLSDFRAKRAAAMVHSTLIIADMRGEVIAQHGEWQIPDQTPTGAPVGSPVGARSRSLNGALAALLTQPEPGFAAHRAPDGTELLVAHLPPSAQREPVFVGVAISLGATVAEIDGVALRAALMAGSASVIALILALGAGEAFIRRPTERLVAAARRWRVGDFSARAPARMPAARRRWRAAEDRSEFGRLAVAFNEMAAELQQRQAERDQAAQVLEARVAERTRALSDTNNRLQVEISEREKTEAALAQAQKLQAVGRLAGGIAHDFNNLLATILGNLELIERRIDRGQERLHAMIQRAVGAVTRGSQLTARLLAFSRRHRPAMAATDVNRLVADLMTLAASTLGRRISVETKLAPELWPAMIDPNQVEAALLNLALNARDAMPEGGTLTIATANETLRETRDGLAPGDYVRVEVVDTGTGMTEDVLRQAFEPFFTTKGPTGSGLGLSQVYGVANQTGGGVRIKSEPGAGTTVALLLPRSGAGVASMPAKPIRQTAGRAPGLADTPRVLLIDDDRAVCQATAEMLREMGCEVLDAPSGEEGLDILQRDGRTIAALVVDYAMPGMTGLEVATIARRMGYHQPILMITGYAELGEGNETGSDLIAEVLRKPFSLDDLESALSRLLTAPAPAG